MNYHATIEVHFSEDPPSRILAIEETAQAICEAVGRDPADCVMMLLTAAAHIAQRHSIEPKKTPGALAECLGNAIIAAEAFFPDDQPTTH